MHRMCENCLVQRQKRLLKVTVMAKFYKEIIICFSSLSRNKQTDTQKLSVQTNCHQILASRKAPSQLNRHKTNLFVVVVVVVVVVVFGLCSQS